MPDMDLSGDLWCIDAAPDDIDDYIDVVDFQVLWKLLAYAQWPRDDSRRQGEIAKLYALLKGETEPRPDMQEDIREVCRALADPLEESFTVAGGWRALSPILSPFGPAERPRSEIGIGFHEAGMILAIIRSISTKYGGIGSVNKALHIIHVAGSRYGLSNKTKLKNSWRDFKSVAHLGFALHAVFQIDCDDYLDHNKYTFGLEPKDISPRLAAVLTIAKDYQAFATEGVNPIVPPGAIWRVPDAIEVPDAPPVVLTLCDEMLRALKNYRVGGRSRRGDLGRAETT